MSFSTNLAQGLCRTPTPPILGGISFLQFFALASDSQFIEISHRSNETY